jgi:hypothetical protein
LTFQSSTAYYLPVIKADSRVSRWIPPQTLRRKVAASIGLLLLYLLVVFIFYHGLFTDFSQKVPRGDKADLKFILSIVDVSIHTDLRDLYNFPMFYPESNSLARTHPLFGISVFFKLFHWLGLNLTQSTNLYIILGLVLGAIGCFLLAREVSGSVPASLAFSLLYIVHRVNLLHFVWLNFFSRFWIPFILFFLLRYFRTGRQRYAAGAAAFAFMEFFACIYLGTVAGIFLLPVFVLLAWGVGLIDWRRLVALGGWFLMALALIIAVFYPYLGQSLKSEPPGNYFGISPADIFGYPGWLTPLSEIPPALFPGALAMAGFVLFFVRVLPGKRLAAFVLLFAPVPMLIAMAFSPGPLMEAVFLAWMAMLLLALLRGWNQLAGLERVLVATFAFFLLVNLKFEHLPGLRSFSLIGGFFRIFPPIRGLREIQRAFFIILPLFTALAAIGAARVPPMTGIRRRPRFWGAVLVFLVAAENFHLPNAFPPGGIMAAIPYRDTGVYKGIPFRSNQVVLEIPHYFVRPVSNSDYLLHWRFHQNSLLNGKGKERPRQYWHRLASIIGRRQNGFPTDSSLRRLLHEYSVGWVIIHWNMLRRYSRKTFDRQRIWAQVQRLRKFGRIVSSSNRTVLIEVREFEPVDEVIRTYSDFHLRRHVLSIELKALPAVASQAWLNGRPLGAPVRVGRHLFVDLRRQSLLEKGNRVKVIFSRPAAVQAVRLWPEKRPLPRA